MRRALHELAALLELVMVIAPTHDARRRCAAPLLRPSLEIRVARLDELSRAGGDVVGLAAGDHWHAQLTYACCCKCKQVSFAI